MASIAINGLGRIGRAALKILEQADGAEVVAVVGGRKVPVPARRDPAGLPWRDLGADLVLECTGAFRGEEDLKKHLAAGARRAILSAPARTETVATVVHGVNQTPAGERGAGAADAGSRRDPAVNAAGRL